MSAHPLFHDDQVEFLAEHKKFVDVVNAMGNGTRRFNWPDLLDAHRAVVEAAYRTGFEYGKAVRQ